MRTVSQLPTWQAQLELRFEHRAGQTVLAHNSHTGPLRVQKALYPEAHGICHALLLHPPAGIAAGDALNINIALADNSHAVISTPGATQWYKSPQGQAASLHTSVSLSEHAKLDYLPQDNILFDHSHAHMHTHITLSPSSSAIGWDACILGRIHSGEAWLNASLEQTVHIHRGEHPLWVEQAYLNSPAQTQHSGAHLLGTAGHPIMGTLWAVGQAASNDWAQHYASQLPYTADIKAGISYLDDPHHAGGLIVLRVLANDAQAMRRVMVDAWSALRPIMHQTPAQPLRIWNT